jgi:hypothetical protein
MGDKEKAEAAQSPRQHLKAKNGTVPFRQGGGQSFYLMDMLSQGGSNEMILTVSKKPPPAI